MLSWVFGKKKEKKETEEEKQKRRRERREAALKENAARAEAMKRRKNPINTETNLNWASPEDLERLKKGELRNVDEIEGAMYETAQRAAEKRSEQLLGQTKPEVKPLEIERDPKTERMMQEVNRLERRRMEEQEKKVGGRRRKRTRRRKKKSKKKKNKKSKKRRKRKSTKKRKRRRRKSRK